MSNNSIKIKNILDMTEQKTFIQISEIGDYFKRKVTSFEEVTSLSPLIKIILIGFQRYNSKKNSSYHLEIVFRRLQLSFVKDSEAHYKNEKNWQDFLNQENSFKNTLKDLKYEDVLTSWNSTVSNELKGVPYKATLPNGSIVFDEYWKIAVLGFKQDVIDSILQKHFDNLFSELADLS